jgi:hypothetical protein
MAQEKCAKFGADATMWVTGETLTLEHPKQYLVYLCPEHFAESCGTRLPWDPGARAAEANRWGGEAPHW